jgi:D-alanyl-D-alanine carboxypeptidase
MKTGNTFYAGACLVAGFRYKNNEIIIVILKGGNS